MTCVRDYWDSLCSVSLGLLTLCGQWIVLHTGHPLVNDGPPLRRHVMPIGGGNSIYIHRSTLTYELDAFPDRARNSICSYVR